jgi:hypothetical protein
LTNTCETNRNTLSATHFQVWSRWFFVNLHLLAFIAVSATNRCFSSLIFVALRSSVNRSKICTVLFSNFCDSWRKRQMIMKTICSFIPYDIKHANRMSLSWVQVQLLHSIIIIRYCFMFSRLYFITFDILLLFFALLMYFSFIASSNFILTS